MAMQPRESGPMHLEGLAAMLADLTDEELIEVEHLLVAERAKRAQMLSRCNKEEEPATVVRQGNLEQPDGRVMIEVGRLSGESLQLLVTPQATVLDMKNAIARADGIPMELVHISHPDSTSNELLANSETVEECALTSGNKLMLIKKKVSVPEFVKAMAATPSMFLGTGEGLSGEEHLFCPRGAPAFVPTHSYLLVVVDNCNHRVKVHDTRSGRLLCSIGTSGLAGTGEGQFHYPHGVTLTKDGKYVVVADKDNERLQVLSLSVSDDGTTAELNFVRFIGKENAPGDKLYPLGVAMRPDGTVVVSDACKNSRILEFTLEGVLVRTLDVDCPKGGQGDVAVLESGNVAFANELSNCIHIFSIDGALVCTFGSRGVRDGQFQGPSHLAADDYGNLMVWIKTVAVSRSLTPKDSIYAPVLTLQCTAVGTKAFHGTQ